MKFWNSIAIREFFDRALVTPLVSFLKQGLSPQKLALSVALGVSLGIFPVLGTTTILCVVAAIAFRLNMPAVQLVNYFSTPLQFLFIIPFIRFGEFIFNEAPFPLDVFQIVSMIQSNMLNAVNTLWWTTIHAIIAWLIVGPLISAVLYFILLPVFIRLVQSTVEQ